MEVEDNSFADVKKSIHLNILKIFINNKETKGNERASIANDLAATLHDVENQNSVQHVRRLLSAVKRFELFD